MIAWQKAMDLVVETYQAVKGFPREELYGLTSQIRRTSVSVPSNIAEGQARCSGAQFTHFLGIARGSLAELETQLLLARRVGLLHEQSCSLLLERSAEVGRLVNGLINSLRQ